MSGMPASERARLASLSKSKEGLLKLLMQERVRDAERIRRYPRDAQSRLPASWAQQRLWFIDQLEGGGAAYHISFCVSMRGPLDREALQKAFDALVERHESLRTVFAMDHDDLVQRITAAQRLALRFSDLSDLDEQQRAAQASLLKKQELQEQFDLSSGPLLRLRLMRLASNDHTLVITMHHIVSDGWSLDVFIRELAQLYSAFRDGCEAQLPALPIQYADYAHWQKEKLSGEVLRSGLEYWRAQLQDAAPQLDLPTDHPRPTAQSFRGRSVSVNIDSALTAELHRFAQKHGLTLFMVLYAAWAMLLQRLSGQSDVVIGSPVANRRKPELEGLIGFFVNTLVLRLNVDPQRSVPELLDTVKKVTLGAYEHQDLPFEKIVEALQPQRSLGRNPLFQVMFALQNAPAMELRVPGLEIAIEEQAYQAAKFDLLLALTEREGRIVGDLSYATDLFDHETVERWVTCFDVLLRDLVTREQCRVGELRILSDDERERVISGFNGKPVSYAQDRPIHALFEQQVERDPDAIATTFAGASLTYGELNARANQLARHLRALGVRENQLVALCLERGFDLVVGLIAILKAGGAYVPLDPNYPPDRLSYMLADAAPGLLITNEALSDRFPATRQVRAIKIDTDWHEIARHSPANPSFNVAPDNLAYVIYTSGSTGNPKGVMVEHGNVTRLFKATEHWFHFGPHDVWSMFHSVAFDFSVWELWGALLYGGRVVIVPYSTARSPADFYQLMCDERVTVLNQTPSSFAQLIEAQAAPGSPEHALRVVVFGGEALEFRMLQPWVARNGAQRPQLINMYGITETTVHVSYRPPLTEQEIASERGSLIGAPIPDLRAYLLDAFHAPVPVGVAAEMYIGGAGVARGYLNRPDLTAQRFLPDPFVGEPGARMYRTGDLGRWLPDGTIEYLGRNDHQVKIRGFRIELGEIEARLATHPRINEAVVVASNNDAGDKMLVAYIVTDGADVPDIEDLRSHVAAALPEYMIPSAFVMLDRLPLTQNGKLDHRALPAPDAAAFATRQYEEPTGDVETTVALIWQGLLRAAQVGRKDNFFALGGHSLMATRVISQIRERFGIELPVRTIFDSPTLAHLADVIATTQQRKGEVRSEDLTAQFREQIDSMNDEDVMARIRELESELMSPGGS